MDSLLGEYMDREGENEEWSGSESGEDGQQGVDEPRASQASSPKAKRLKSAALYQCPDCPKTYKSVAGFREHMTKKHGKPDV